MGRKKLGWRRAAGNFRDGDLVIVDKKIPHADKLTPALGTLCQVVAVDAGPGKPYPLLVRDVQHPSCEDWVSAREVYLWERQKMKI